MTKESQTIILEKLAQKKYQLDCEITLGFAGSYKFSEDELKQLEVEREKVVKAYKEMLDSPQLNKQKLIDWLIKEVRDEIYEKENQRSKAYKEKCKDPNYTITEQEKENNNDGFIKFIGKNEMLNEIINKIIKLDL